MQDTLIVFNLSNGAELIGKLIVETDVSYTIEQPLVIRPTPINDKEIGIQFFPHSMVDPEGKHEFFKPVLSRAQKVPPELAQGYLRHTSNLVIASTLDGWELGKK